MTMVARPNNQQRSLGLMNHPYQQVILILFIVFAIGLTFQRAKPPTAAMSNINGNVATAATTTNCQNISYTIIKEGTYGGNEFTRYAAQCIDGGGDAAARPVTILEWASNATPEPLIELIRACKYEAVFFETKGASNQSASTKSFEFVLVNAPHLKSFAEAAPDDQAFAEYINRDSSSCGGQPGCVFTNLGGDATLIAPSNKDDDEKGGSDNLVQYSHLAAFCRKASPAKVSFVWKIAIQQYAQRLLLKGSTTAASESVWFSTSGLGIAWLHFRIDRRPKYYQYRPFADET